MRFWFVIGGSGIVDVGVVVGGGLSRVFYECLLVMVVKLGVVGNMW